MDSQDNSPAVEGSASVEDERAVYGAFAQEDYYLEAWQPLLSNTKGGLKFNLAAAFFGMNWCFYRKLYGLGLLLLVCVTIIVLIGGVIVLILNPGLDAESMAFTWTLTGVALLAVRVPFGFIANRVYLRKATGVVAKAKAKGGAAPFPWTG